MNPGEETPRSPARPGRPLLRSRDDRYIGGVAAGIARHLGVDPGFVRAVFAVSLVVGGIGIAAYAVLLATMPVEGDASEPAPPVSGGRRAFVVCGVIFVGLLLLIAAGSGSSGTAWLFGFGPGVLFGVVLWLAVGVAVFLAVRTARASDPHAPLPPPAGRAAPRSAAPPLTPPAASGAVEAAASISSPTAPEPPESEAGFASSPTQNVPPRSDAALNPADPPEQRGAPAAIGRIMTWVAIVLATIFAVFFVGAFSFAVTAAFGPLLGAMAVLGCGIAIVWLALIGRPGLAIWAVVAGVAIAIPMSIALVVNLGLEGDWGDVSHRPLAASEIPDDGYALSVGTMRVDLRGLEFREGRPVTVRTDSSLGATEIFVPDDVCVVGEVEGDLGVIDLRGSEEAGFDVRREVDLPDGPARLKVLRLDSEFTLGYLGVRDDTSRRLDLADLGRDDWQSSDQSGRTRAEEAAARRRAEIACTPGARISPREPAGGRSGGSGQPARPGPPDQPRQSMNPKAIASVTVTPTQKEGP
jgi:phage shock protein PspC (stress-responsive transcriptional regulator)